MTYHCSPSMWEAEQEEHEFQTSCSFGNLPPKQASNEIMRGKKGKEGRKTGRRESRKEKVREEERKERRTMTMGEK